MRRRARQRDARRGAIATLVLALLLAAIVGGGYGVHSHVSAGRAALRATQLAAAAADLRVSPILFVPPQGETCRRRWIDNGTWTISDGGSVDCGDAGNWSSATLETQSYAGIRFDAVRAVFRSKNQKSGAAE